MPAQGSQRVSGGRLGKNTPTHFVLLWLCSIWGHQCACFSCQLLVSQSHSGCMSLVEQVCNCEMLLIWNTVCCSNAVSWVSNYP